MDNELIAKIIGNIGLAVGSAMIGGAIVSGYEIEKNIIWILLGIAAIITGVILLEKS